MTVDPQIRAVWKLLREDHEAWIAEVQGWADQAGAEGDLERQRRHLEHVERLKAIPYPWERSQAA